MLLLVQAFLCLALQAPPSGDAVMLRHKFVAGETSTVSIVRTVSGELQAGDLVSWLPFKITYTEKVTTKVLALGPSGTADVRMDMGESVHMSQLADSPAYDSKSDPDWAIVTMSPTNQVLKVLELPKPKKHKSGDGGEDEPDDGTVALALSSSAKQIGSPLTMYLFQAVLRAVHFSELINYGPRLPYYAVKVGDTWQSTVTALPGQTAGTDPSQRGPGRTRVDVTFRFDGLKQRNKTKVWVIHGSYSADLDLKSYFLEGAPQFLLQLNPITTATIKVKGELDYYVEPKLGNMVLADGTSTGEAQVDAPEEFTYLRSAVKLQGTALAKPVTPAP